MNAAPNRIVWAALRRAASDGEIWEIMLRSGEVEVLTVITPDMRPVARPLRCWPWSHEYRARRDWHSALNDGSAVLGEHKAYMCCKCGKGKLVLPRGVF
jgi:hypothetical protein